MRVVSVAGYRGAGKTSLVERLVPELAETGRVATVKSIHHDVDIDSGDTDTARHRVAGAEQVVGVAPSVTFSVRTRGKSQGVSLDSVLADLENRGYDYVVVEGFKEHTVPAVLLGDIDESAVGGTVLFRVETVTEADIGEIVERVRNLPPWERLD